jgi:alpha-tubulin suppressor-like RCC1 family protein
LLPEGNDYVAIAAGIGHSVALKRDGSLVCCGRTTERAGSNYVKITAGGLHSLALRNDGTILCWGDGCGRDLPSADHYLALAAGERFSFALKYVCGYTVTGDLNDDCKVDMADFAVLAQNWMIDCDAGSFPLACTPK